MGLGLEEGIGGGGGFLFAFVGGAAIDVGGRVCDGLDGAAAGTGGSRSCGPGFHRFFLGGLPGLSGGVTGTWFHRFFLDVLPWSLAGVGGDLGSVNCTCRGGGGGPPSGGFFIGTDCFAATAFAFASCNSVKGLRQVALMALTSEASEG